MPQVFSLQSQLTEQLALNRTAEARNQRAGAELADLKEGLEMVEEKARRELGMVRADEILVQYTTRAATAGSPANAGAPTPPRAASTP
jgi:cell division protein FtsB